MAADEHPENLALRRIPEWCHVLHDLMVMSRNAWPAGGTPLHRNEGSKPFFIVGAGRSGNTLLRRILQANPAVHIPPENYVLVPVVKLFRQNRHMKWRDLVDLVLARFEFHSLFYTFEMTLEELERRLVETPEDRRSLAHILNSFCLFHAEKAGVKARRWGDKTPLNVFYTGRILAVFPDALFIHLLRDGVDSVASLLKAGLIPDMTGAAARWSESVKAGERLARRHPRQCMTVRYEHLVREPARVVPDICSFLGIPYDPAMLSATNHVSTMGDVPKHAHHARVGDAIDATSIGRGYKQFTPDELKRLRELIGRDLRRLGYES